MQVEVVFALPDRQELVPLELEPGATVTDAIRLSGIERLFPDQDLAKLEAGIWGTPVPRSRLLQDGDRVEIYRPLQMDPRDARRELAAQGRSMGKSDDPPDDDPSQA